jgi:hypothetical protein
MAHNPDGDADDTPAAKNPIVKECIEDALAPYRGLLPPEILSPEMLEGFAETLDLFLTTHPVAVRMVRRLQPDVVPMTSAERDLGSEAVAEGAAGEAEAEKSTGTEGGRR